jgi:hypothetical protein
VKHLAPMPWLLQDSTGIDTLSHFPVRMITLG